jgi:hypothetical protein
MLALPICFLRPPALPSSPLIAASVYPRPPVPIHPMHPSAIIHAMHTMHTHPIYGDHHIALSAAAGHYLQHHHQVYGDY